VTFLRSRRGLLIACAALLLALFLVRPGASRLKARIANSVGMALQRQVEIGKVHLRLLPRPGFDLEDFVVHDDPAFSAEPVLRAQEVSASLRLSSLLRGRLEISRLSLTEPSLNLTRNSEGQWNIENLLERTAKTAVAPTSKSPTESRPAFPYIEADHGRINFKLGPEKKPFAFTEADYAFWQDSENAWGMRLKARPMRTDFNLSDTGQFQVSGTWLRATTLRETPVRFNLQWEGAQLGQVTKLLSGQDRGWRGTVAVSADLTGRPADLSVRSDGSLEDFRRYDILGGGILALHTHCDAHYSSIDHGLHKIFCQTPAGDGAIALLGDVVNLSGRRRYALKLAADKVPVQSVLALVRHVKKNLPEDLVGGGTVAADFNLRAGADIPQPLEIAGNGQATDFHLQSNSTKTELALDVVPFSLVSSATPPHREQDSSSIKAPEFPRLTFGPLPIKLGRPIPSTAQAWITRSGYDISLEGETDVQRLLQMARTIGIPAARPAAEGWAKVALHVTGEWSGFAGPRATGTAQLHAVRADVVGLSAPIEISSANLNLTDSAVRAELVSASLAGSHWTGSLSLPRMCGGTQPCLVGFNLHTDEIATDDLSAWFSPNLPKKRWYGFLSSDAQPGASFLTRLQASGTLIATRLLVRNLTVTHVTTVVKLDRGQLHLADMHGDVMGGTHRGDWRADFTLKPPTYSGAGTLQGISLSQLAEIMHDGWITGAASAKYKVEMAGRSRSEFTQSATGTIEFNMRDGALPHIALASGPLKVRHFTGVVAIHDGELEMEEATLESPAATFEVTGRASMSRKLDFKLVQEGSPGINVTGTVAEPRVVSARHADTRASLKP
jgi:AsmA family/AsmA-like C-terminal region